MDNLIKSLISKHTLVLLVIFICSSCKGYAQGNSIDTDLSGHYESSNGKYILQLMQVNPSAYYYEFIPKTDNDSIAILNTVNGIFNEQQEDSSFKTVLTDAFQSGFDFKFLNTMDVEVKISRFSYDYRYSDLIGKYSKLKKSGEVLKPHYEMFYNKDKFQTYRASLNGKELYLCYFPLSSNKVKMVRINKKTCLKIFTTIFNFALGDMSERYYYVEISNGKNIEYGWLDYSDLKYFKLIGKT